jgi:phosphopantetheine--protein transferase-like protein
MEDRIKDIISPFIKIPADQIGHQTIISQKALKNSIMLHRMYAQLANAGIVVENYGDINSFGILLQRLGANHSENQPAILNNNQHVSMAESRNDGLPLNIGIDIEEIASMPVVDDFREDAFYTMNFSPQEIAYCILQQNPYASFSGLFAAKEAIVKADNGYMRLPFNSIHIEHSPEGKPVHHAFQLSVTHTDILAIAVALQFNNEVLLQSKNIPAIPPEKKVKNNFATLMAILSFLLALIAIIFATRH